MFESRSTKTKLDKDYDFVLDDGDHTGETVHIKNWRDLDVLDISTAGSYGADYGMGKYLFAKQVTFVTDDGTELKSKEYGVHEKDTFEGYEFVETHTAENGDTVHVYKKVVTSTTTPEPEQPVTPANPVEETPVNPTPSPETPVNPTNPGDSGNINGGNDEDTTPANPTGNETPVSPTPTPNPTPNPDVPVMEDNHGNNAGGNTETPSVPNPTPEPSVPTDETPVQPVNPTEEKPVVPNNPTDNTVVPPTVEEKPAESTVSNKVEENTVVNNTNSSTTSIKKDDRVIETGVRTSLFTNFAMAVVSGIGLLAVAFKKKESK